jgi:drug/metabolite transporter (DMT)-like permease
MQPNDKSSRDPATRMPAASHSLIEPFDVHSWKKVLTVSLITLSALIAFAANSVLCRFALGAGAIDAGGFACIRLLSGAAILLIILLLRANASFMQPKGSWLAGLMLFLYAISFSYAYLNLNTGTGALILFGAVQITMICFSIIKGNRLVLVEWLGLAMAFLGLVYLVLPGVSAPSPNGFLLMTTAGIAWGVYTLKGRGSVNPLADTAFNFTRSIPFVMVAAFIVFHDFHVSANGAALAFVSGAITSGLGYSVWYAALRHLSTTQAAVAQLAVPIIAALGGIIFMAETITLRLGLSAIMILGGIFMVVMVPYFNMKRIPDDL